ncbi:hypothetical protein E2Q21_21480 [Salmonella enterica subsp. enterica serovar Java]|uniref:Uncharacterized protein n=2 Tax=Salmonella enterica TaxID=28901 RepID=A0A3Z6QTM6_SALEB|nr:hypothetical protein [Salmonella enterica]EAB6034393.1 hypothetical protein [Salmonella enterica subsp. enterica serovar Java]EBV8392191.1 hypothetical protein [Salmonella enterica subsp. enterica serovar Virchow]ECA0405434.1 hypothetical protein [Salmonella enterica subsp. enterica serovar Newport]ECC9065795.1 hypothetical protein [Salmonella enterica subsp. diarizonae]ECM6138197.1 hypothetical protein [Salmonella enterica subsp. enterica serovar Enteritidis]EDE6686722.1 hypothetical prot
MSDNTLPATAGATQALISLIMLAQQLQSEKDGIRRPDPRSTGAAGEEPDKPAQRVQRACVDEQRTNRLPAWLEQAFPADHTRGKTA